MFLKMVLISMITPLPDYAINDIHDFKWNNRALIIKDNHEIKISEQIDNLATDFDERDFVIIHLKNQKTFINNVEMSKKFSKSILKKVKNISENHYFILIGKDGGIKHSYPKTIDIKKIFFDVDKMPMRILEVESKKSH
jgi:hypothetical protein